MHVVCNTLSWQCLSNLVTIVQHTYTSLRTGSQMEQGKKENRRIKRVEHGLWEKNDGGDYRLCFDAADPGYQILLS